jgi:hypothetical protein
VVNWADVVQQIDTQHPFFNNIRVFATSESSPDEIPDLLRIVTASAIGVKLQPESRLAIVMPRLDTAAVWVAFGTALSTLKTGFHDALSKVPVLEAQTKVLIDGKHLAIYERETETGYKVKMHNGNIRNRGPLFAWTQIPKRQRLRLQSTTSLMPLSQIGVLGSPPIDDLDQLLGIQTFGNRTLFNPQVILVTGVGRSSNILQKAMLLLNTEALERHSPQDVASLIQWGIIKIDGKPEIRSTGQIDAPPVLLLAPDLLAVKSYLKQYSNCNPLVILEGSNAITRRADVLDDVLDRGCSTLACIEYHEEDVLTRLAERDFGVWSWSRQDVHEIQASENRRRGHLFETTDSFSSLRKSNYNFSRNNVVPQICDAPLVAAAAGKLHIFEKHLESDLQTTKDLEGRLYGCLLGVTRLLYRFEDEASKATLQKIRQLHADINLESLYLSCEAAAAAHAMLHDLETVCSVGNETGMDKVATLRRLITEGKNQSTVIVVGNTVDVKPSETYWRPFTTLIGSKVRFCDFQTATTPGDCSHLIICGWLGKQKMRRLLDGCLAPKITILLYAFEQIWLRSVLRKWNQPIASEVSATVKSILLNLQGTTTIDSSSAPGQVDDITLVKTPSEDTIDIEKFELRLEHYKQAAIVMAAQPNGEEIARAFLVRFASGYYAFLTENHRMPVATDILNNVTDIEKDIEFPRRRVSEIEVGDYIIFREGAQGDVLRAIADKGLKKSGKQHLRETASLWKQALRDFVNARKTGYLWHYDKSRLDVLVRSLRQAGINTTEYTIETWIVDDYPIGPRGSDTIDRIAVAVEHEEMRSHMEAVRSAIREVRGAHLQASSYLSKQLFAALPQQLEMAGRSSFLRLDLEELGSVMVVQVEEIMSKPVEVAWSKANFLLSEYV